MQPVTKLSKAAATHKTRVAVPSVAASYVCVKANGIKIMPAARTRA